MRFSGTRLLICPAHARARLAALATLLALALAAHAPPARAQTRPTAEAGGRARLPRLASDMNESVLMLRTASGDTLETTLFRPDGPGPFPTLIYNHGKEAGAPTAQTRARPLAVARAFVTRGYLVAVPMRRGFARSSGAYRELSCDAGANGLRQAEDIAEAVDALRRLPEVDASRIVLLGASYGGLASIAYARRPAPGVRGVVNFSGGLWQTGCLNWQDDLAAAFARYGQQARLPSLWLYGANDQLWPDALVYRMFADYAAGGSRATLVDYGHYKNDSHRLLGDRDGVAIWWPPLAVFLTRLGLPTVPRYRVEAPAPPTPSGYAAVHDVVAVPFLDSEGRLAYQAFLQQFPSRAFALSASGAWAWAEGGDDPAAVALDTCQRRSRLPCRLYAVDDTVVWTGNTDASR